LAIFIYTTLDSGIKTRFCIGLFQNPILPGSESKSPIGKLKYEFKNEIGPLTITYPL